MARDWYARNRHRYPPDWPAIAAATKTAAGWRCDVCGNPHGPPPYVLTVHHLNFDPGDCSAENLLACCQRCHLRCQGLRPRPATTAEAIARLRRRYDHERAQLALPLVEVADGPT